ncbi:DNA polymerase III subunit alpha [Zafaria sp. Z1313]|uniref:DNA polymerase III subunit alpha n=1 Tax=unclassified Zafaria TaxID=2828765 RepID=UPI002E760A4E|nr:DNA polymerase III subunit alpha [Zafaria sp. J156]MEE1621091.1 DNA polymerase III subunit alpha [Zafaria sp. J156]
MSFTHLHVSSAFSARYGVSWPDELVRAAAAAGADALACTDRDGLYGIPKHFKACLRHGIDPVVGVDLAVLGPGAGRVVVLARGNDGGAGYTALCRLVSAAHAGTTSGGRGASRPVGVTPGELARWAAGPVGDAGADRAGGAQDPRAGAALTVLLGPQSDVGQACLRRGYGQARQLLERWRAVLPPGALAVEAVTHVNRPGARLSTAHAVRMVRAARDCGVPAVLGNAVRYAEPDGAATADVLDAARALSTLEALDDLQPNGQGWLKEPAQMHRLAGEVAREAGGGAGLAAELLAETARLADHCRMDPVGDAGWGIPVVPEARVIGITGDPARELAARCEAGITRLFPDGGDTRLRGRLATELDTIASLGFCSYFLTVAEVSSMIAAMGVRAAARGSGASSLVNYLLGVSHVNPLAHDLLFERFLSLDRSTLPDIDIDVESAERHAVYRRIFERFGRERVTLMSMQNGYRARGAVRDAGLVLGFENAEIDDIAKQLWRFSASGFRAALAEKPELRGFAERVGSERQLDLLVDLTERLDRLPRHISMHPCGVILGDSGLLDRTPVQPSGLGLPMSQFDKHDMDPMGMLKLDVLGVRMQSAMSFALREVVRIHGSGDAVAAAGRHPLGTDGSLPPFLHGDGRIDLERVPLDDEPTFELIRSTHTLGCFQIESPGQRELIGKLAPREFNDLIIDISLFRPGPMKSNMVKPYLENRHGFARERYPHPDLVPALAETHGVTVFHEQVLRTFATMTGCSLAKADVLRRLLGSETQEPAVEAFFRSHATARGYPLAVVDEVWETLKAFGSFGFCKAHGAAFAVPTYQSAWLKTHHPEAFLAGLWEHDPGMYPKRLLVAEARRMGIPILPLDINRSCAEYRVERVDAGKDGPPGGRLGIRLSLSGIYGMSATEVRRTVAGQPYASLADVRDRAGLTRSSLERLAALGAFDELQRRSGPGNRSDLVRHLREAAARRPGVRRRQLPGQLALPLPDLELSALRALEPAPTAEETVRTELDLMALDVSGHLMDSHAPLLAELGTTPAAELLGLRNGTEVLVAGVRVATQTPPMRGGRRVVFISLDDGTGCVDCTFFHDAQENSGPLLFATRLLLVHGITRRTGPRGISLQALQAWDLSVRDALPGPGHLADPGRARPQPPPGRAAAAGVPAPVGTGHPRARTADGTPGALRGAALAVRMEAEGLDNRLPAGR